MSIATATASATASRFLSSVSLLGDPFRNRRLFVRAGDFARGRRVRFRDGIVGGYQKRL
jgi:hypothetical protein